MHPFLKKKSTIIVSLCVLVLLVGTLFVLFKSQKSTSTPNQTLDKKIAQNTRSITQSGAKTMGWLYPGMPACSAIDEIKDGRNIDTLKPEYLKLDEKGDLQYLTNKEFDCNGYSKEHAKMIKENSREAIFMVSGRTEGLTPFFKSPEKQEQAINKIMDTVKETDFDGAEIDYEDFASWTDKEYATYKTFIKSLGERLNKAGKKLSIDVPAIKNDRYQSFYKLKYEDFVDLPVDYFTIMTYDFQYDEGVGAPVASFNDIRETLDWVDKKFPDKSRVVVGLNNYGYYGKKGEYKMALANKEQIFRKFKDVKGVRDEKSGELVAEANGQVVVYSDGQSLNQKRDMIFEKGYNQISVWHLGGNDWFSK
jgi:spore germination protein YaaH